MSTRTPAGDKGTADRIEADDGGYWVRLVTKQAIRREGEAMQNCLRQGAKHMLAGDEETLSCALWSLRKRCGTSYALAEVGVFKTACQLGQFLGPYNNPPSPWAVRQIRHLRALFAAADLDLWFDPGMALVGPDGMTYRPDVAPADLRAAAEAERIESEKRAADREAERRRDAGPSLRSMPVRFTVLEEVDAEPVTPEDLVAQQAAERAFFAGRGMLWPGSQAVTVGADTQPPAPNTSTQPETAPSPFAAYADHMRRSIAASLDLSYEEFTRDWRDVSEASERARLTERIRDRCLIITTPPMDRAVDLNLPVTRKRRYASPIPPGACA